jgi:hypothetical protein
VPNAVNNRGARQGTEHSRIRVLCEAFGDLLFKGTYRLVELFDLLDQQAHIQGTGPDHRIISGQELESANRLYQGIDFLFVAASVLREGFAKRIRVGSLQLLQRGPPSQKL